MAQQQMGGIRLFRLFGIDVYLHWLWFVVAAYEISSRTRTYTSPLWNVAEYLALFAIVLMHEFGHSLACRSVGGEADRIILWPLGGVAFVSPPQRPGATLWSIAAGPLVNVLLIPFTVVPALALYFGRLHLPPDLGHFVMAIGVINIGLLIFNLLPIYPLDGGQILRSLLWFVIGPTWSLQIVSVIGLLAAAGGVALAVWISDMWIGFIALFGAFQSWKAFQYARQTRRLEAAPRHLWARCPQCGNSPPIGAYWRCACGQFVDPFASQWTCPNCGARDEQATCPNCRTVVPAAFWYPPPLQVQAIVVPPQAAPTTPPPAGNS